MAMFWSIRESDFNRSKKSCIKTSCFKCKLKENGVNGQSAHYHARIKWEFRQESAQITQLGHVLVNQKGLALCQLAQVMEKLEML